MGLLLLRVLVSCSLIVQGAAYVHWANRSLAMWAVAAFASTCGALLLIGLMTPLAAVSVVIGGIGIALSLIPLPSNNLFDSSLAILNLIGLSIAIALLGPGAFSLDARMFGRREITIPSPGHVSRS